MKKVNLIMLDFAHQDTRSTHAMLFGYGDRREDHGFFGGDDLDKALASGDELKEICVRAKKTNGLIENQEGTSPEFVKKVFLNLIMGSVIAGILSLLF